MKHAALALSAFAIAALGACHHEEGAAPGASPDAPGAVTPPSEADTACLPSGWQAWIGKPVTTPGVPPATRAVRHIRPDTQVTMDYRPDRVNIEIDEGGIIRRLRCG
jgi:hypothetical protein